MYAGSAQENSENLLSILFLHLINIRAEGLQNVKLVFNQHCDSHFYTESFILLSNYLNKIIICKEIYADIIKLEPHLSFYSPTEQNIWVTQSLKMVHLCIDCRWFIVNSASFQRHEQLQLHKKCNPNGNHEINFFQQSGEVKPGKDSSPNKSS